MTLDWRRALRWVGLGAVTWAVLLASPLGFTHLELTVTSSGAGTSSVGFSTPSDGSPGPRAVPEPLAPGPSVLSFRYGALQAPFTEIQSWRPCDCATTIQVSQLRLQSALFSRTLDLDRIQRGEGILDLSRDGQSLTVTVDPTLQVRPTLTIAANTGGFLASVAGILLGVAVGTTIALFAASRAVAVVARRAPRLSGAIRARRDRIRDAFARERAFESLVTHAIVRVPLILVVVSSAVLAGSVVMMVWGALSTGIWVDEPTHVGRMVGFLDDGWYVPLLYQTNGAPSPDVPDVYVYGPVQAMIGHAIAILIGADPLGTVSVSAEAYAARHIGVVLVALIGVAATAGIARLLFGSWRWALLAAAALTSIPLFTGHAMFNVKDVAVSTGYTVATLGFIVLARATTRRGLLAGGGFVVVAMVIGMGTRPGIWPAYLAGAVVTVVASLVFAPSGADWPGRLRRASVRGVVATGALIVGWGILYLIYPNAFGRPRTLLFQSFESSAGYREDTWRKSELGYLPTWLTAQVPLLLLVLGLLGLGMAIAVCIRRLARRDSRGQFLATGLALVSAQLVLVPVFAAVRNSVLYNGLRQVEFILPALAVLVAFAVHELLRLAVGRSGHRVARVAVTATAVVAMLLPTVEQAMLFPYNTLYLTRVGEALLASQQQTPNPRNITAGAVETSNRELSAGLATASPLVCGDPVGAGRVAYTPVEGAHLCQMMRNIVPFMVGDAEGATIDGSARYVFDGLGRYQAKPEELEACDVVASVTRPRLLGTLRISDLLKCPAPALTLEQGTPMSFADGANETALAVNWSYAQPNGVWSLGPTAALRFSLPADATGDQVLSIRGYRFIPAGQSRSMDVLVNGTLAASAEYRDRWVPVDLAVPLSASAVRASDGVLFIQLVTPDPVVPAEIGEGGNVETLSFWLESVTLSPAAPR
jgi:hypothetical protein